jgi:hypothetical protein
MRPTSRQSDVSCQPILRAMDVTGRELESLRPPESFRCRRRRSGLPRYRSRLPVGASMANALGHAGSAPDAVPKALCQAAVLSEPVAPTGAKSDLTVSVHDGEGRPTLHAVNRRPEVVLDVVDAGLRCCHNSLLEGLLKAADRQRIAGRRKTVCLRGVSVRRRVGRLLAEGASKCLKHGRVARSSLDPSHVASRMVMVF